MILTILAVLILLIGVILLKIYDNLNNDIEIILNIGAVMFVIGCIASLILILGIIFSHAGTEKHIHEAELTYKGLIKRYEIVSSEYEDMSKSDVIKDITEWNKHVYSEKYWSSNSWTNWFYDKEYADSLNYIELEE